jgi:hypothetical protein
LVILLTIYFFCDSGDRCGASGGTWRAGHTGPLKRPKPRRSQGLLTAQLPESGSGPAAAPVRPRCRGRGARRGRHPTKGGRGEAGPRGPPPLAPPRGQGPAACSGGDGTAQPGAADKAARHEAAARPRRGCRPKRTPPPRRGRSSAASRPLPRTPGGPPPRTRGRQQPQPVRPPAGCAACWPRAGRGTGAPCPGGGRWQCADAECPRQAWPARRGPPKGAHDPRRTRT